VDVHGIRFAGADDASPAPGVLDSLRAARVVVIAPSNPLVSIGPMLAVPGIREALAETTAVRVAISPIIAGQVVKGPLAKMMTTLGFEVSAVGVAEMYRGLVDVMVIDEQDRALAPRVEALGMRLVVTDTMMTSDQRKADLAAEVVAAAGGRG
jgi:LPPG:FO 2-phospho-L-lactate transferase